MRGWMLSGAAMACVLAACAGPRTEPLERPRPDGWTPAEQARTNELYRALQMGSSSISLDPRQRPGATPERVTESLPPVPSVLPIVRPRTRGDALSLADLALDRGDPLDAAAQYRALLGSRDLAIVGYINVRLAEAYHQLGQLDRADAALLDATRSPDFAWYAVAQLALHRARVISPVTVVVQLAPYVPRRVGDLENLLIHSVDRDDAGALLMAKAQRDPSAPHACEYAVAAVTRGYRRIPSQLDRGCQLDVERAIAIADRTLWLDERNPCRQLLSSTGAAWEQDASSADPAFWLALSERYVHAMELALTNDDLDLASRSALGALFSVARVILDGAPVTPEIGRRFGAVADVLNHADRHRLSRVMALGRHIPSMRALWSPSQPAVP